LSYLIILKQSQDPSSYQNIRIPGRVPSTLALQRPLRQREPLRQRLTSRLVEPLAQPLAEPVVTEALERLGELEQERLALHTSAETLSATGISPDAFERLEGLNGLIP
jgi:hypothetical protein